MVLAVTMKTTHNREFFCGGEPGQDLASFGRPVLKVWSYCLLLLLPLLPPQVLKAQHLFLENKLASSVHFFCVFFNHGRKAPGTAFVKVFSGLSAGWTDPRGGAVWHGGSLAGWGGSKHGEGVGPVQHGAERVGGCRGGGGGRRGGAAFTGPTAGLCICHLGGEERGRSELLKRPPPSHLKGWHWACDGVTDPDVVTCMCAEQTEASVRTLNGRRSVITADSLPWWVWGDGSLQTQPAPPQDDISAALPHSCANGNALLHSRQTGEETRFSCFCSHPPSHTQGHDTVAANTLLVFKTYLKCLCLSESTSGILP